MNRAMYPGSFDPITVGHLELIERAAQLFEQLIVVVGYNPNKQSAFTVEERLEFVRIATAHLPNVSTDSFTRELLVSYARRVGATIVVRGLRSVQDYEHEWTQAQMNRRMFPQLETVFLFSTDQHSDVSSTGVRDALHNSESVRGLVPDTIVQLVTNSYRPT